MGITVPVSQSGQDIGNHDGRLITRGFGLGFTLVVSLFFMWAIANNLNDILIRQFQKALGLDRAQAGFIQFVFYIGYFVVALPAGLLMRRLGYKAGILIGLGLYCCGALLFYPASIAQTYGLFLAALFILASGAAFLETAANPYVVVFGDPMRAAQRLNLAQAFNGLGGFLAPIIGGVFIFSGVEHSKAELAGMSPAALATYRAGEAHAVQIPYLCLAAVVALIALAVWRAKLPETRQGALPSLRSQLRALAGARALHGAIVAQFFYVGAQVGIWSFSVDFIKDVAPEVPERTAAFLLSASLVMFMIGRFGGAALMQWIRPVRLLGVYGLINILLCAVAMSTQHWAAIGALMLTSFFMSIMFPTIFSLGVKDLGDAAPLGASFVIMSIIGGAVFPPLMGLIATKMGTIQVAIGLPLLCFAVISFYAQRQERPSNRRA